MLIICSCITGTEVGIFAIPSFPNSLLLVESVQVFSRLLVKKDGVCQANANQRCHPYFTATRPTNCSNRNRVINRNGSLRRFATSIDQRNQTHTHRNHGSCWWLGWQLYPFHHFQVHPEWISVQGKMKISWSRKPQTRIPGTLVLPQMATSSRRRRWRRRRRIATR